MSTCPGTVGIPIGRRANRLLKKGCLGKLTLENVGIFTCFSPENYFFNTLLKALSYGYLWFVMATLRRSSNPPVQFHTLTRVPNSDLAWLSWYLCEDQGDARGRLRAPQFFLS